MAPSGKNSPVSTKQLASSPHRPRNDCTLRENERETLLKAHYAGAVSLDMLKTEMDRLIREISTAEQDVVRATASLEDVQEQLQRALLVASNCAAHYVEAKPAIRRLMNQGFFNKIFVGDDGSVSWVELTEPFAALLAGTGAAPAASEAAPTGGGTSAAEKSAGSVRLGRQDPPNRARPCVVLETISKNRTPGQGVLTRGSKMITLAEAEGFEPPVGFPTLAFKASAFGRSATLP